MATTTEEAAAKPERASLRTHFTWSVESPRGKCPDCYADTALVWPGHSWSALETDDPQVIDAGEDVHVSEEITGHWCPKCERLVSLSLNT